MKPRFLPVTAFALLLGLLFYRTGAWTQQPSGDMLQRFTTMSRQAEERGLAEPFKGITANGTAETGLFSIRSTGVSTEPARKAAAAFLESLTADQKKKTVFPLDDPEWRKWMNQHFYIRQGVSFLEMSEAQRSAAIGMLRASLSARGLQLTRDIMKLNETLGELNNNDFVQYGEWRYHLTVMGTPSQKEPWGWQIDGHHCIINYFVLGDQVVMSPFFAGSEPVIAKTGKYKGVSILQEEQAGGLELVRSLSADQRKKAVIQVSKTGNNNIGEAFKDNVVLDYVGAKVSEWNDKQRQSLLALVQRYVGNMDEGHAKVKMEEVKRHLDRTYFAWIGATEPDSVFYYRIHSPVILIEFDHQLPVGTPACFSQSQDARQGSHSCRRADTKRQRLRQGSAAPPLPEASALQLACGAQRGLRTPLAELTTEAGTDLAMARRVRQCVHRHHPGIVTGR